MIKSQVYFLNTQWMPAIVMVRGDVCLVRIQFC